MALQCVRLVAGWSQMTGMHQEAEDVHSEGWKIRMKARRVRRVMRSERRKCRTGGE